MFYRWNMRPAFEGNNPEDASGHRFWHHRHHGERPGFWQRPHFFEMRGMGHGFFGPRGPFGHGGPFGPGGPFGGPGRRFFGRGDLKYALLELLQERPMHGYEMMKSLEERSGGFYVASAGSVYPTLQMLEDRGLVSASQVEGKKVYSITDAGRAFLAEHSQPDEEAGSPWRGFEAAKHWNDPELQALRSEGMEVARLFVIASRMCFREPARLAQLRAIIEHVRKDLSDMIYSSNPAGNENPQSSSEAPKE